MFNIYHDFTINESSSKIYKAVSDPEHLNNWWTLKCTGKPALNETYNLYFSDEYNWFGKVIKCESSKAFHIKMTQADEDWTPTSFGFDIIEMENACNIQFWHKGWPKCNSHFKKSSFCWASLLRDLKNYVEKGIVVPFEERE